MVKNIVTIVDRNKAVSIFWIWSEAEEWVCDTLANKFTGLVMNMICLHDDNRPGNTEVLEETDASPF
jgi:hypothetical protein